MYWKPWPSFFILPRNGMKFSTLLHAIQKKSEKDTTRPVKNYMDCIAVFRTSSRYWEIGRASNAVFKKIFPWSGQSRTEISFDNKYRYNMNVSASSIIHEEKWSFFLPIIKYVTSQIKIWLSYQLVCSNLSKLIALLQKFFGLVFIYFSQTMQEKQFSSRLQLEPLAVTICKSNKEGI